MCNGCPSKSVSADSVLDTEASWDGCQLQQTGWAINTPPTGSVLHRSSFSSSLLGFSVPQHSNPYPNTQLGWKAQTEGTAWWVLLNVLGSFCQMRWPVQCLVRMCWMLIVRSFQRNSSERSHIYTSSVNSPAASFAISNCVNKEDASLFPTGKHMLIKLHREHTYIPLTILCLPPYCFPVFFLVLYIWPHTCNSDITVTTLTLECLLQNAVPWQHPCPEYFQWVWMCCRHKLSFCLKGQLWTTTRMSGHH